MWEIVANKLVVEIPVGKTRVTKTMNVSETDKVSRNVETAHINSNPANEGLSDATQQEDAMDISATDKLPPKDDNIAMYEYISHSPEEVNSTAPSDSISTEYSSSTTTMHYEEEEETQTQTCTSTGTGTSSISETSGDEEASSMSDTSDPDEEEDDSYFDPFRDLRQRGRNQSPSPDRASRVSDYFIIDDDDDEEEEDKFTEPTNDKGFTTSSTSSYERDVLSDPKLNQQQQQQQQQQEGPLLHQGISGPKTPQVAGDRTLLGQVLTSCGVQ